MDLYTAQLAGSRGINDPLQLARMGDALIAAETARLWVGKACCIAEGDASSPAAIDAYVDLSRNAFEQVALRVVSCAQKAIGLRAFTRRDAPVLAPMAAHAMGASEKGNPPRTDDSVNTCIVTQRSCVVKASRSPIRVNVRTRPLFAQPKVHCQMAVRKSQVGHLGYRIEGLPSS